ncbi:MAG TPA: hypothetical protein VK188_08225 [Holophaga sp.]|nr:hypothetical protein [Holophaga sp.]
MALPLAAKIPLSPLPADAWSIKAGDPRAPKGAVVLEERLHMGTSDMEWTCRIRIVSEEGQRAVAFAAFGEGTRELTGRTIRPDGTEILFDSVKDFKKETLKVGSSKRKFTNMVPPGVTSNCIVEVYHRTSDFWLRGRQWHRSLVRPWPIQEFILSFDTRFPARWGLQNMARVRPEVLDRRGDRIFLFRDLPAQEEGPFLLTSALDRPTLVVYPDDRLTGSQVPDPDAFWLRTIQEWYRPYASRLSLGSRYKEFSRTVREGLPAAPQEAAKALMLRAHAQLANFERLTWEEKQQRKEAGLTEPIKLDASDLSQAVKYGGTDDWGWLWLGWQLLTDAGLKPRLLGVCDREDWIFRYSFLNPYQIEHYLLGIEEPGKDILWVDPSRGLLTPGVIYEDYQGTPAMLADLPEKMARPADTPVQPASSNTRTYAYQVTFQDDRQAFTLDASFQGNPAYIQRDDARDEDPQGREKALLERLQTPLKGWTLAGAKVMNLKDVAKPFQWSLKGSREWEEERRLRIDPFPGLPSPLDTPSAWPAQRSARIVLPFLQTHRATSRIQAPKGYRIVPQAPFQQDNLFGSVRWKLTPTPAGDAADVELVITVDELVAGPEAVQDLRAYLGWIQEALRHPVTAEKGA